LRRRPGGLVAKFWRWRRLVAALTSCDCCKCVAPQAILRGVVDCDVLLLLLHGIHGGTNPPPPPPPPPVSAPLSLSPSSYLVLRFTERRHTLTQSHTHTHAHAHANPWSPNRIHGLAGQLLTHSNNRDKVHPTEGQVAQPSPPSIEMETPPAYPVSAEYGNCAPPAYEPAAHTSTSF
jgi:hypothetical protein